jgi:hypothetical protein
VPGVLCAKGQLVRCEDDGTTVTVLDDCVAKNLACAPTLLTCTPCLPGFAKCGDSNDVMTCNAQGQTYGPGQTCDGNNGVACRNGQCVNLCQEADDQHSNVGCEYWAADLDNAVISPSLNAAAQQYAIVVSNVEGELPAKVTVDEDDSLPGQPAEVRLVGTATVAPRNLEVFKLGPREVDGSADGTFNTGPGTFLSRHAYRVKSNVPIVAYQFNPFQNVNVFSNDASMLLPVSALGGGPGHSYVVAGWPQTIARTNNANTNFGIDLSGYLAIIATRPDTHVHLKATVRVIPGPPALPNGIPANSEMDFTLQPFEILNLETSDFNADFTGSIIDSDQPVAVFPGSEASDAPFYDSLANRFCCADHLETQLFPIRTAGQAYVASRMPNRTKAVIAAGANIGQIDEPEIYRAVATRSGVTHVTTSLPPPDSAFDLADIGDSHLMTVHEDFTLKASQAVILSDMQVSQEASGVLRGLPGGDPSLSLLVPVEQWRTDYVLFTPDKYVFDFLVITAPADAHVFLDGAAVDGTFCEKGANGTSAYVAYRCELSFPVIDPTKSPPNNVSPGRQNDGVHHVQADEPIGVIAYGFDSFVSYAYAAGTELKEINVK